MPYSGARMRPGMPTVRLAAVIAAAALVLHELRYLIGFGDHARRGARGERPRLSAAGRGPCRPADRARGRPAAGGPGPGAPHSARGAGAELRAPLAPDRSPRCWSSTADRSCWRRRCPPAAICGPAVPFAEGGWSALPLALASEPGRAGAPRRQPRRGAARPRAARGPGHARAHRAARAAVAARPACRHRCSPATSRAAPLPPRVRRRSRRRARAARPCGKEHSQMSRNQRIALVLAAVLVAVVAFVVASPGGDDDDDSDQAAQTTTTGDSGAETTTTHHRGGQVIPPSRPSPRWSASDRGRRGGGRAQDDHGHRRATGCASS